MYVALTLSNDGEERMPVRGTKVMGLARQPRTYETGRVCITPGCRTILSRYNRTNHCSQHESRRTYLASVPGRRAAEISVLRDLSPILRS